MPLYNVHVIREIVIRATFTIEANSLNEAEERDPSLLADAMSEALDASIDSKFHEEVILIERSN